ncbi:MAG: twin-arginine translocase subunit TatC [Bacteroidales bacterium]|nr:twin-arginine translocase subunit TatC [Bacteroidales bacterium]
MAERKTKALEMSFWDHLEELRFCVLRSLAAVGIFSLIGFIFKGPVFDGIVLLPTRPDFFLYRWTGLEVDMELINIDVTAQFFIHLKMAVALGFVVAFPYIIWQIWRFIAPALYEHEKKAIGKAFLLASILFYLGVAVGYCFVLPVCLNFFMGYSVSETVNNTIALGSYIALLSSMVLLIGLVFEFPTVIMALSRLGIVGKELLRKYRRHAFMIILILSALITPSDPVSMLVLSIPLYLLYEFSILLCRKYNTSSHEEK